MLKVYEHLRRPLLAGLLGVEVEVEANKPLPQEGERIGDWVVDHDNSLRGQYQAEFILNGPLPAVRTVAAIKHLSQLLEDCEVQDSFRTSVHVHVNVQDLTLNQLKNFIYTYLLLERVLVEYSGKERKNNRFCLRVEDAEGIMNPLEKLFTQKEKFVLPLPDQNRYASINLDAIGKYGSLEFRSMRGTINKDVLTTWVKALVFLKKWSIAQEDVNAINDFFVNTPDEEFVSKVLGKTQARAIITDDLNLEYELGRNYSLTVGLLVAHNQKA